MVANRPQRQGTVQDLINGLLDRGYNDAVQPTLNAVARSTNSGLISQRLNELDKEVQRLMDAGEKLTPDNAVLRALLADLEDTMTVNGRVVDGASEAVQQTGMDAAARIQRQLALPGMTDAQLARIGITWNKPDPEAVARLIQYSQSDAWAAQLTKYGTDIVDIINNQAIRGIASGWSPLRTASQIRNMTENLPGYQANNLLRTLQLTSYRDATAANQNANVDIIDEVIRIAALDDRTCLSCVALHGTVIWSGQRNEGDPVPRVDDHHSGRCTCVVQVKGRTLNIQSGKDWFDSLPPERQQQQAGFAASPAKWEAFKNGQVKLDDFVHQYKDPTFGNMLREGSLSDALKKSGFTSIPQTQASAPLSEDEIRQIVTNAEADIRGNDIETLIGFSSDGTELFRADGNVDRVKVTDDMKAAMNGATVTHNHPPITLKNGETVSGTSFSPEDVLIAARNNVGEMRVVTALPNGRSIDYSLTAPPSGWSSIDLNQFAADIQARWEQNAIDGRQRILNGESFQSVNVNLSHSIWRDMANDYGYSYQRTFGKKD